MSAGGGGGKKPWWHSIVFFWTSENSGKFAEWINSWAFDPLAVIPPLFALFAVFAYAVDPEAVAATFAAVVGLSPVWLVLFLFVFFWTTWMHYIRFIFWFKQRHVLLEIQLPPEVPKSPLAMELFLSGLWNSGGETTFLQRVWKGQFRAVTTLEIASNEGQVKFYIHVREGWRNMVEARLYGQFPEAKITVAEDYAAQIPFNLEDYDIFGSEYDKSDPHALPIKSYIDYGLDKNPDTPEIQVDPITNLVELLGQVGQGEYYWFQIIMKPRKKDEWHGFYISHDHFVEPAKAKIKAITKSAVERAQELTDDEAEKKKVGTRGSTLLSPGEKNQVEAIERSLSKLIYECGFRVIYLARKDRFNGANIGGIIRFFDAYRQPNYNGLGVTRGTAYFDYPWQDIMDIRKNIEKRNLFFRYKHRAYFYVPYEQKPVFMTTEELATIWHFPNSAVRTPGLDRVPSRRSEAPTNLPT